MKTRRLHFLQHVEFESIGSIAEWSKGNAVSISSTELFANQKLPEVENIDFLVILGGPMGVYDEGEFRWLIEEKRFIKSAIKREIPILGICLGAQLIAVVLGARVYKNANKEIGWFPIQLIPGVEQQSLEQLFPRMLENQEVFHWHGDTFDLPEGAIHLARSEACKHQAFFVEPNILGLQFHLELDLALLQKMLIGAESDLIEGPYVQSQTRIIAGSHQLPILNQAMDRCLSMLFKI